jgi:rSAM/selenodomain-associated transferase 1
MNTRVLVVAKAPVAGRVKTRLGADIGDATAAELAAAALLDTLAACREAFGPEDCLLALAGDLADAVRGDEIADALAGWHVGRQRGSTFAERLANAHVDVPPGGPVVQVGMDTPQLTPDLLHAAARALEDHDAVLGPAEDGGWWVLGLREPAGANALHDVPMSTPTTYDETRRALEVAGLDVGTTTELRDVDTVADAVAVAGVVPRGEFARAWREVRR